MEDLSIEVISEIQKSNVASDIEQNEIDSRKIGTFSSSSDDEPPVLLIKKRVKRFSESDCGADENSNSKLAASDINSNIKDVSVTDEDEPKIFKNESQQSRMKNKRAKMKEKFKNLLMTRTKDTSDNDSEHESDNSGVSDAEISSISKIKQIVKEKMTFKSSICDADTSDDDDRKTSLQKQKPKNMKQKRTVMTSPKPIRITAKQAIENMQKIKSESNRLLREKEVSLPYHRPRAFTLKDIMNRRRLALTSDGKILPIKMNEEQLKEYALQLEQRQKEIMELCKSDSDEENDDKSTKTEEHDKVLTDDGNSQIVNNESQSSQSNTNNNIDSKAIICDNNETSTTQNTNEDECDISNEKSQGCINNKITTDDNTFSNIELSPSELGTELTVNMANINEVGDKDKHEPDNSISEKNAVMEFNNINSNNESQLIMLHYDSEKNAISNPDHNKLALIDKDKNDDVEKHDMFEDDFDFDDIDMIIENAEILEDKNYDSNNMKHSLNNEPKLTGAPGMVIDLDGNDGDTPKKLSGLELLKERFTYFAQLKTPEELEREREKRVKPGTQHKKLKQELEEKIAEQRSIEWAKRLEDEKKQEMELKELRGETSIEDDLEKIEAKLEETSALIEESSSEEEESEEIELKEKPRKRNPMFDDEAEVTDCEDEIGNDDNYNDDNDDVIDNEDPNEENSDDSSEDESSESESEEHVKKKGRILKAFEDSDDEIINEKSISNNDSIAQTDKIELSSANEIQKSEEIITVSEEESRITQESQDDVIQLAQRMISDDIFITQKSTTQTNNGNEIDLEYPTQTFSIPKSDQGRDFIVTDSKQKCLNHTQDYDLNIQNAAFESETYTANFIPSQITKSVSLSESQPFGEDILALCTGQFYNNAFISQTNSKKIGDKQSQTLVENNSVESELESKTDLTNTDIDQSSKIETNLLKKTIPTNTEMNKAAKSEQVNNDSNVLQSILEELHDPEFDKPKPNKYFFNGQQSDTHSDIVKKKLVIDSDDETNCEEQKRKKKIKKRKLESRALQISDDEDDEPSNEDDVSDLEDDTGERIVEYDSEENEIEVHPQNPKKKRKAADFFEQEAELTSEDEWIGSGDEDEAGLDRMEREEGDDDVFHEGKLQKELEQIHMRDVLDQDKREVRLIQELLFEDGDLGDGHRQRKFRWKNADGDVETGTIMDGLTDTQEEEFESEELWRKQRHEREVYLRQMTNENVPNDVNVSVNRTKIIKANLCSKTMSSLLMEANTSTAENIEKTDNPVVKEKKPAKDLPSPKRAFTIFQQNYHNSLLTRGRGALARLAALATPLALDDDAPKLGTLGPSNRRNFVFASITPDEKESKISKRKADTKADTPRLVKRLKTDEKKTFNKNSLLNHLKV